MSITLIYKSLPWQKPPHIDQAQLPRKSLEHVFIVYTVFGRVSIQYLLVHGVTDLLIHLC